MLLNSSHTSSHFALGVLPIFSMSYYESDNYCCIGQGKLHLCSERLTLFYRKASKECPEEIFVYIIVNGLRILNKKEEISKNWFIRIPIQISQSQEIGVELFDIIHYWVVTELKVILKLAKPGKGHGRPLKIFEVRTNIGYYRKIRLTIVMSMIGKEDKSCVSFSNAMNYSYWV